MSVLSMTKTGRKLMRFRAKYRWRAFTGAWIEDSREISAVNEFQAKKKASGIAKKHGWEMISIGRI